MRFVVLVEDDAGDRVVFGAFKTEPAAARIALVAFQAGALAEVFPIIPGRRYTSEHPATPLEDDQT